MWFVQKKGGTSKRKEKFRIKLYLKVAGEAGTPPSHKLPKLAVSTLFDVNLK